MYKTFFNINSSTIVCGLILPALLQKPNENVFMSPSVVHWRNGFCLCEQEYARPNTPVTVIFLTQPLLYSHRALVMRSGICDLISALWPPQVFQKCILRDVGTKCVVDLTSTASQVRQITPELPLSPKVPKVTDALLLIPCVWCAYGLTWGLYSLLI